MGVSLPDSSDEGAAMPVMIYDPLYEQHVRAEREQWPNERDEVWEGVLVVPALPNFEHQIMVTDLALAFMAVIDRKVGDLALAGANVSDRDADWTSNYREPDVLVMNEYDKVSNGQDQQLVAAVNALMRLVR